jgi:hypothetical protein
VNYYNDGTSPYWNDNIVHSLVVYEWMKEINLHQAKELLDRFASRIGRYPDHATVVGGKKGRDYTYNFFIRRNLIDKENWAEFGYSWRRYPGVLSGFSIDCFIAFPKYKHIAFHIDEASTSDVKNILDETIADITKELSPIYGYCNTARYGDGPDLDLRGMGSGPYKYQNGELIDIDHNEDTRRGEFGRIFRSMDRPLDRQFRDIYPINLISGGHLKLFVEGLPLSGWIARGYRGTLEKIGEMTWKWSLSALEQKRVRKTLLDAGHLVVSV